MPSGAVVGNLPRKFEMGGWLTEVDGVDGGDVTSQGLHNKGRHLVANVSGSLPPSMSGWRAASWENIPVGDLCALSVWSSLKGFAWSSYMAGNCEHIGLGHQKISIGLHVCVSKCKRGY